MALRTGCGDVGSVSRSTVNSIPAPGCPTDARPPLGAAIEGTRKRIEALSTPARDPVVTFCISDGNLSAAAAAEAVTSAERRQSDLDSVVLTSFMIVMFAWRPRRVSGG